MLPIFKYHGLGNDFVLVERPDEALTTGEVVAMCDRHRGIGADGVLVVSDHSHGDVRGAKMIIYNRDGSRPEMCGNGVRCVAAFAHRHWELGKRLVVASDAGNHDCHIVSTDKNTSTVNVDMGPARAVTGDDRLEVGDRSFEYVEVDVGNPHAVIFSDPDDVSVEEVGRLANDDHRRFPDGINVEFAVADGEAPRFRVAVYERGVGLTEACGTGACAVAKAAWTTGRVDESESIAIDLPGGPLRIEQHRRRVWMTGGATEVFRGQWNRR